MTARTLPSERIRHLVSRDPSNGEEIGRAALMNADDVVVAVRYARAAQPAWAALSYRPRAEYVLRARELVLAQTTRSPTSSHAKTGKRPVETISMEIVPTLN